MWEIPVYGFLVPIITLTFSLISAIKFKKYFIVPIFLFIVLNIPTIILPMIHNVGWEALLGWASFYTFISLVISLIVWLTRKKQPIHNKI